MRWWILMRVSTRFSVQNSTRFLYESCESRLENLNGSRLDFYVRIWKNFPPVGWQTADLMLRSLSPQYPDTFMSIKTWKLIKVFLFEYLLRRVLNPEHWQEYYCMNTNNKEYYTMKTNKSFMCWILTTFYKDYTLIEYRFQIDYQTI